MPELPEVNTVMEEFRERVLFLPVTSVEIYDARIIRNVTPQKFISEVTGRSFISTYRQGKYFFAHLNSGFHILFHLGMTGDLHYYQDQEPRPDYERFRITFSNNLYLGYSDLRKFSHILFIEDLSDYLAEIKLGPDALKISLEIFLETIGNKRGLLKAVLMDQHFIAGIGNLYADEICFQAKIHPASQTTHLTEKELTLLYHKMQEILHEACKRKARYLHFPEDWFWNWRDLDSNVPGIKGQIKKMKIGGRTTYYVEGYQVYYG